MYVDGMYCWNFNKKQYGISISGILRKNIKSDNVARESTVGKPYIVAIFFGYNR